MPPCVFALTSSRRTTARLPRGLGHVSVFTFVLDILYSSRVEELDGDQGFEPQLTLSESAVLPLDESPLYMVPDDGIEPS